MTIPVGIIGTDSSHSCDFTRLFAAHAEWGVRVTVALPGGSPDIGASWKRVDGVANRLKTEHGVRIAGSIGEVLEEVDAVMILSVDGRQHLEQARATFEAGKPAYINKPLAASLADAQEIVRLFRAAGVPFFSSSSVRFQPDVARLRGGPGLGRVTMAQGSSILRIEPHHPDLFWYGVHGVEALYTMLGPGCVSVRRGDADGHDITTGTWQDGCVGVYRGVRGGGDYLPIAVIRGTEGEARSSEDYSYEGLLQAMAGLFRDGAVPVDPAETLEIFEFMTAAQLSRERGGAEVSLAELRNSAADSVS